MNKNKQKKWTLLVLSDANKRVFQLNVPKLLPLILITIFSIVSLSLLYNHLLLKQEQQNSNKLAVQLSEASNRIEQANDQIAYYETEATSLKEKVSRLTELEQELATLITSINPAHINESSGQGATGGVEISIEDTDSDTNSGTSQDIETTNEDKTLTDQYKELSKSVPELITSYQKSIENFSDINEKLKLTPTYWPTDANRITSTFGKRSDPFSSQDAQHTGIDIAGSYQTPVYAGADGQVTHAGRDGGYGISVVIKHSSGIKTRYGHLSSTQVEVGQKVKKGEKIALMGSTGRSTGVHLHYEILKNGVQIDPYIYMTFMDRVLIQK